MTTYNRTEVRGLEVFYREAGPKDGRTIVLLHGFPSSSHMFRDLIPKLADRYHIIAPDYIGFGYSAHPGTRQFSYTFENLTAVVEELLFQKLNLKKFSIYVQDYAPQSDSASRARIHRPLKQSLSRTATHTSKV